MGLSGTSEPRFTKNHALNFKFYLAVAIGLGTLYFILSTSIQTRVDVLPLGINSFESPTQEYINTYFQRFSELKNSTYRNAWGSEEIFINSMIEKGTSMDSRLIVLDGGSNVGTWARNVISSFKKHSFNGSLEVHCFEPIPQTFKNLSRCMVGWDVNLHNKAISNFTGHLTGVDAKISYEGSNFLECAKNRQVPGATVIVEATTIDKFWIEMLHRRKIWFLKLDIEGFEFAGLQGSYQLLSSDSKPDFIEWERNSKVCTDAKSTILQEVKFISEFGYNVYIPGRIDNLRIDRAYWHPGIEDELKDGKTCINLFAVRNTLPMVEWLEGTLYRADLLLPLKYGAKSR